MRRQKRLTGEAEKVYASLLKEPDYRLAGLHNNLSLLYAETGRLSEAEKGA